MTSFLFLSLFYSRSLPLPSFIFILIIIKIRPPFREAGGWLCKGGQGIKPRPLSMFKK
jgi:hypothetical protein